MKRWIMYTDNYIRMIKKFTRNDIVCHKYGHMDNGKFSVALTYNDPRTVGRKFFKFIMFHARIH